MQTTLTNEELDVLNKILQHLPYNEAFTVTSVVENTILKPTYKNDTVARDIAFNSYKEKNIIKNINSYLVENYFAILINDIGFNHLMLTAKGEVLVAYGNLLSFIDAINESSENTIIERVPHLIAQAFPYGEFIIEPIRQQIQLNINIHTNDETGELERIKAALDPKEQIKRIHKQSIEDEEVLQYLVSHGFAVNRHDIKAEEKIYRQLTDKGRKLKELGSIQKYVEFEKVELNNIRNQKNRDIYLFWIVLFGALGACISAYNDFLQSFDFYSRHSPNWQHVSYFLSGLCIGLLLWLLSQALRKTLRKT